MDPFTCSGCGVEKLADSFGYTCTGRRHQRCLQCNVCWSSSHLEARLTYPRHRVDNRLKLDGQEQQCMFSSTIWWMWLLNLLPLLSLLKHRYELLHQLQLYLLYQQFPLKHWHRVSFYLWLMLLHLQHRSLLSLMQSSMNAVAVIIVFRLLLLALIEMVGDMFDA